MSGRRSISEDGEPKMMADPMKLKTAGRRASVLGGPGTEDGPIHVANGAPKTMSKPVQTRGRRSSVTMGSSSKISSAGELIGRRRESMSSGSDGGTPRVMQQPTTSGRRGSVTTGSSSSGSAGGLIESQAGAVEQAPKMSKPTKIGGRRASMTIGANMPAAAGGGIGNRRRSVGSADSGIRSGPGSRRSSVSGTDPTAARRGSVGMENMDQDMRSIVEAATIQSEEACFSIVMISDSSAEGHAESAVQLQIGEWTVALFEGSESHSNFPYSEMRSRRCVWPVQDGFTLALHNGREIRFKVPRNTATRVIIEIQEAKAASDGRSPDNTSENRHTALHSDTTRSCDKLSDKEVGGADKNGDEDPRIFGLQPLRHAASADFLGNLTTLKAVAEESELEVSYGESPVTSPAQPVQSRIEPLSLRVQADAPSGR